MPKNETTFEIGAWRLSVDAAATRAAYEALMPYTGSDVGLRMFHAHAPHAPEDAKCFWDKLGVLPAKILNARPISGVQEDGSVLFLAKARLCGSILAHSFENGRRKSEETAEMSVVFVDRREEFCPDYPSMGEAEVEMRFVIALPFQKDFFDSI